ncbi:MAG TPA: hypothetical protein VGH28_13945 [Polyangiaceae bacterium]|jgi:hypothetical protein
MIVVFGFDPSTERTAAWARLTCGRVSGEREYEDKGENTLDEIRAMLKVAVAAANDGAVDGVVVGIERPPPQLNVHVMPGRIKVKGIVEAHKEALWAARAKAGSLIDASYVAGALAWMARELGARVVELTPDAWRAALNVRRTTKGTDQGAMIKDAIVAMISGWPKVSNEHVRDGAGVALAAYWQVRAERKAV